MNQRRQKLLRGRRYLREIDADEYAELTERLEHRGQEMHRNVMREAMVQMGWEDPRGDLDYYRNEGDFETYWSWAKDTDHAEYYREQARSLIELRAKQSKETPPLDQ